MCCTRHILFRICVLFYSIFVSIPTNTRLDGFIHGIYFTTPKSHGEGSTYDYNGILVAYNIIVPFFTNLSYFPFYFFLSDNVSFLFLKDVLSSLSFLYYPH